MTPLAARLFRETDNTTLRKLLSRCQFFECSALYDFAQEMLEADVEAGCLEYSEFAQLPANPMIIELMMGKGRVCFCLQQDGLHLEYRMFAEWGEKVEFALESGFTLGSGNNDIANWNMTVLAAWSASAGYQRDAFGKQQAPAMNGALEKMLCMINQAGLIERQVRPTDKRVMRIAAREALPIPESDGWNQCRIRPGAHGEGAFTGGSTERQLHYVRKHFRPSLGRWIEGYWRGNIELGVHLKFYSPQPIRV